MTPSIKRNRSLGIRCRVPNLSGGYHNCDLDINPRQFIQKRSGISPVYFLVCLWLSQHQLCMGTIAVGTMGTGKRNGSLAP